MRRALLLLVVLAGLVVACEEKYKDPDPKVMGYEYYPLEVGDYRIYHVTDIRFQSNIGDTARFQMRERVDTTFYDQTNTLNYKIIRSVRANENQNWVDDSVMVVTKSDLSVILTKNNIKYVKMVFPVKEGKTWQGDAFNDRTNTSDVKETYTFSHVGESYTVSGLTFDSTATVIQGEPTDDFVTLDDRKEVFAKGVGAIYRLYNRVVYCRDTESKECPFAEGFKLHGHERHEELISYGKE